MRLVRVKPKGTDPVVLEYVDGTRIYFSYESPIAAYVPGRGYIVTDLDITKTDEYRVQEWLGKAPHEVVPQSEIFAVITDRPVKLRTEIKND